MRKWEREPRYLNYFVVYISWCPWEKNLILTRQYCSWQLIDRFNSSFELKTRVRVRKERSAIEVRSECVVAWGLKKWLRAIRSFHPVVTIMLSFTLEGDRWRVAGTFDTGTLQQEFDRPSCKRSSLLLYLFFLFLSISFFLSFSLISVSISSFSLSVSLARLLARSCLLTLSLLHASYSIDRLSPSSSLHHLYSSHPLLLFVFSP